MSPGNSAGRKRVVSRRTVLRTAGVAGVGLAVGGPVSGQGSGENWPTYRGNAANSGRRAGPSGVATAATERWHVEPAPDVNFLSVRDGTVYLSTDNDQLDPNEGRVRALDAETGEAQWIFESDLWVQSTPVATADAVYALANGGGDGRAYRLDRTDGSEVWSRSLGSEAVAALQVAGGTVYVGEIGGTVVALDTADGSQQWETNVGNRVWRPPAVVDGSVYVTGDNGGDDDGSNVPSTVHALDAATGEGRWRHELGSVRATCPVAVDARTAYVVDYDGTLHALATDDGSERWTFDSGRRTSTPPLVGDGQVYSGGNDGLSALDADSGEVSWRIESEDGALQPVGTTDAVYATVDGVLTALDPDTGDARRLAATDGRPVAVTGDSVYVSTRESATVFTLSERVSGLPVSTETPSPTPTRSPTETASMPTPSSTPSPTPTQSPTETTGGTTEETETPDATTADDGNLGFLPAVSGALGLGILGAARHRRRTENETE